MSRDSNTFRKQQGTKEISIFGFCVWTEGKHLHRWTATTSVSLQTSRGAYLVKTIPVLLLRKSVTECENVYDIVIALYCRRSHSRSDVSSVWLTPKKQTRYQPEIRGKMPLCHVNL